jgi:hypothetical protein
MEWEVSGPECFVHRVREESQPQVVWMRFVRGET